LLDVENVKLQQGIPVVNKHEMKYRTDSKRFSITTCMILVLCSCGSNVNTGLANGLWKIRKVQILKDSELKKTIDTGYQYWNFQKRSTIEIFDAQKIHNVLHIKIGNSTIRSYDVKGNLQDEFVIEEIDNNNMALSSKKKVDDSEYNIIYFLDKVKDTSSKLTQAE
jgi:hypothetical protein